jgi:hypothetical protein
VRPALADQRGRFPLPAQSLTSTTPMQYRGVSASRYNGSTRGRAALAITRSPIRESGDGTTKASRHTAVTMSGLVLPWLFAIALSGCVSNGEQAGQTLHLNAVQCRDLTALRHGMPLTSQRNGSELAALETARYHPEWSLEPNYPGDLQAAQEQVNRWYETDCQRPAPHRNQRRLRAASDEWSLLASIAALRRCVLALWVNASIRKTPRNTPLPSL